MTMAPVLLSYGPDQVEMAHHQRVFVDKILRGARPADLPVEQPTRFQLVVNQKTAKALNMNIPTSLLLRADEGDRIEMLFAAVHESAYGTKQTIRPNPSLSAIGVTADIDQPLLTNLDLSPRPSQAGIPVPTRG